MSARVRPTQAPQASQGSQTSQAQSTKETFAGTVKSTKDNYGFVEVDGTGEMIFMLPSECRDWGGSLPWVGTRVILQAEPNPNSTKKNAKKATHVWHEPGSRDSKKHAKAWDPWEELSRTVAGYMGYEKRKWQQEKSQNDRSRSQYDAKPNQKFHGTMDKDMGQYGFILQDAEKGGEPQKMFVLPYSCPDLTLPPIGSRVEFTIVADPKTGKPRAEDVVPEGADDDSQDLWNPLPGEFYTGTFCKDKNTFGFIKPDDSSEEVFVLPSGCSGFFNTLPPLGTRVKFMVEFWNDGQKMKACKVTELDAGGTRKEVFKGIIEKNFGSYGFIKDGEEEIFVLPTSCKGRQIFEPGTFVVYRKVPCERTGKVRAESVDVDFDPPLEPAGSPARSPVEPLEADDNDYVWPEDYGLKGVVEATKDSYGFIKLEDSEGQGQIFLHVSQCPGRTLPPVGSELQFDKTKDDRGRTHATNVLVLQTPEPPEPAPPAKGKGKGKGGKSQSKMDMRETPEPDDPPRKARSYRSPEVAILWKRYCDENAEGLYDPEEHSALFLREFLHAVLPGDLNAPAKRQRT